MRNMLSRDPTDRRMGTDDRSTLVFGLYRDEGQVAITVVDVAVHAHLMLSTQLRSKVTGRQVSMHDQARATAHKHTAPTCGCGAASLKPGGGALVNPTAAGCWGGWSPAGRMPCVETGGVTACCAHGLCKLCGCTHPPCCGGRHDRSHTSRADEDAWVNVPHVLEIPGHRH